jgi:hypothetical protein
VGQVALAVLISLSGFGDYLYARGDYASAAVEYLRLLYESGDTLGNAPEALRLARCWQETGDPDRALGLYAFLGSHLPSGELRGWALMGSGSICEQLGMPGRARESYLAASAEFGDGSDRRERCLVLAALSSGRAGDWDSAAAELGALSAGSPGNPAAALESIARRASDPPRRSGLLCGAASAILPGAGQALCGHWMDASTAFLMTAGAGALLAASLEEENTSTSIFFGWLALSFYGGNVWGGVRAAGRWNSAKLEGILAEVPGALSRYPVQTIPVAPLPTD